MVNLHRKLVCLALLLLHAPACGDGGGGSGGSGGSGGTGGEGQGGAGGQSAGTELPVDCRDGSPDADTSPVCNPDAMARGTIGAGEPFSDGPDPEIRHGFADLQRNRIVVFTEADFSTAGAIFGVDLATGDRTVISGTSRDPAKGMSIVGEGPEVDNFHDVLPGADDWIALVALASDPNQEQLIHVDPGSGARTLHPHDLNGDWGAACAHPDVAGAWLPSYTGTEDERSIAVDAATGRIFVQFITVTMANAYYSGIVELDGPSCRIVTAWSSDGSLDVGKGQEFDVHGMLRYHNGLLYTTQKKDYALMSIDPKTGDRLFVSAGTANNPVVGKGPEIAGEQFGFAADGTMWTALNNYFVLGTVDYAGTGDRTPSELKLNNPYGMILPHPTNPKLVFWSDSTSYGQMIWVLEPATGNRNVFSL